MGSWLLATSYRQSEFKIRNSRLESVINGKLVAIYQLPHARSQKPVLSAILQYLIYKSSDIVVWHIKDLV